MWPWTLRGPWQTDRQADREKDRQTDRMADRETEGQTDRQRYRQREAGRDREGEKERVIDVLFGISHICHLLKSSQCAVICLS